MTDNWKEITDPEELFRLKREGWEIEMRHSAKDWEPWHRASWQVDIGYRARPPQPKMKKVKMLCFYNGKELFWAKSGSGYPYTCRVPDEDKEIEVPQ